MKRLITMLAVALLMAAVCQAEERNDLTGTKAKNSYSLGYEFGNNLRAQEIDLDERILLDAIRDALGGRKPAMRTEDMRDKLKQLRKEVLIRYNLRQNERAAQNKRDGEAFLADNRDKKGVTTLNNGLQYRVLTEGSGPRPSATDRVKVAYRGTFVNGMEFDSSAAAGAVTARVNEMIPAWTEALQRMRTGAKWQLFVPPGLAYGGRQFGKIPPNSTLIYELELVSIDK